MPGASSQQLIRVAGDSRCNSSRIYCKTLIHQNKPDISVTFALFVDQNCCASLAVTDRFYVIENSSREYSVIMSPAIE